MAIAASEYEYICSLIKAEAGIVLEAGKEYLVEARLSILARNEKLASVSTLVQQLKGGSFGRLRQLAVEAMTTNETSFFRDHHPFEALKKVVLPSLLANRAMNKSLSIWCGASSTGQEPYTIAMILCETVPNLDKWNLTFIATDISAQMIERSREGKYSQIDVNRGLPAALLIKYFEKRGLEWQIKERLRRMIDFREMNLTRHWPQLPSFDIIFLRNVLIYFDQETKRDILARIRRLLKPDGSLFLGCAETTFCVDDGYERTQIEKGSWYRLKQPVANAA